MPNIPGRIFRITLTCGCTLSLRNPPMTKQVRYGCPSGVGHGYSLAWTAWHRLDRPVNAEAER